MRALEASGPLHTRKLGRARTCAIEPVALRAAEGWIAKRRGAWEESLDRLGQRLAEHPEEPPTRSKQ